MQKEFDRDIIVVHADLCILKIIFLTEQSQVIGIKNKLLKSITKTLVLASFFVSTTQAHNPQKKKDFSHDFTVGIAREHYQYSEATATQKHAMHFKGMMSAIEGSYQMTWKDSVFIRPELRVAYGKVDYEEWRGDETRMRTPSAVVEPRLLIGVPWKATDKLTLSPYTGISHRYKWDNDSNIQDKAGYFGAKRRNYSWYIPVGVRMRYDLNPLWSLQLSTEYDFFLSGRQYKGGEKKRRIPAKKFKQTQGKGLRGEFLVGRQFEKIAVSAGFYAYYLKVKKTDKYPYTVRLSANRRIRGAPYEPKNVTTEIGLKFNIHF